MYRTRNMLPDASPQLLLAVRTLECERLLRLRCGLGSGLLCGAAHELIGS